MSLTREVLSIELEHTGEPVIEHTGGPVIEQRSG
jgi:hypothetical protein